MIRSVNLNMKLATDPMRLKDADIGEVSALPWRVFTIAYVLGDFYVRS